MRILLVNPNRYQFPPVIPVGLEYLSGELSRTHHESFILDLCFEADPHTKIIQSIEEINPDIIGFTIRQIDSVLYQNNEFFLKEIKEYVSLCKTRDKSIILGGAGFSIMPNTILQYLGADYGIIGPGERALLKLLEYLEKGIDYQKLLDGYLFFNSDTETFHRQKAFDYDPYLKNEGIVGFRTQIGCNENCFYCTEGKKQVIFHNPDLVGKEIASLKQKGFQRFHLCDSEFNLNLDHCIKVCQAIIKFAGPVDWSLYLKPQPFSLEFFGWLKESGVSSITLSLDSKNMDIDSFKQFELFLRFASKMKFKVAIDLSIGFPYEDIKNTKKIIEFLHEQPTSHVGVNSFYRIYPGTPLYHIINNDPSLEKYLINWQTGTNYLYPIFFNFFPEDQVREIIAGRTKFRLEGWEKSTNYQRLEKFHVK